MTEIHILEIFYLKKFIFRKRGREGNVVRMFLSYIDVREKHQSVASRTGPKWGQNPQPRHVPGLGIEPLTFCFAGQHPTN